MADAHDICPFCGMDYCEQETGSFACIDQLMVVNRQWYAELLAQDRVVPEDKRWIGMYLGHRDPLLVAAIGDWLRPRCNYEMEAADIYCRMSDEDLDRACMGNLTPSHRERSNER